MKLALALLLALLSSLCNISISVSIDVMPTTTPDPTGVVASLTPAPTATLTLMPSLTPSATPAATPTPEDPTPTQQTGDVPTATAVQETAAKNTSQWRINLRDNCLPPTELTACPLILDHGDPVQVQPADTVTVLLVLEDRLEVLLDTGDYGWVAREYFKLIPDPG